MSFWSAFYEIDVRDEIAKEFTDDADHVDDMMAGLHEIRARMAEQDALTEPVRATVTKSHKKTSQHPKRPHLKPQKKQPNVIENHISA